MERKPENVLNPAFLVTRRVPVEATPVLAEVLSALPGMDHAGVDAGRHLELRYDASRIGFDEIEKVLDDAGVAWPDGFLWRMRAEWFRFTDGNARANAQATPACCSRPPVAPGMTDKK